MMNYNKSQLKKIKQKLANCEKLRTNWAVKNGQEISVGAKTNDLKTQQEIDIIVSAKKKLYEARRNYEDAYRIKDQSGMKTHKKTIEQTIKKLQKLGVEVE